jgi:hypothetical protein
MPDDHSKLVPLLPIPNRTVKRLSADDSAGSRVKVGHRQAITALRTPHSVSGGFCFLAVNKLTACANQSAVFFETQQ